MKLTLVCLGLLITSTLTFAAPAITGSGSSFAYPLMKELTLSYSKFNPEASYASVGSRKGVDQLISKEVDFAVSDVPLSALNKQNKGLIQIPLTVGAAAIVYNIGDIGPLKLSPDVLVKIFNRKIKKWDDPAIQELNTHLSLPSIPIKVVYREDASGTTHMISTYFSAVSDAWKNKTGITQVYPKMRKGIGVIGSNQVAKTVSKIEGAIGYVEWHYAIKYDLPYAAIKNSYGQYVRPSLDSIQLTLTEASLSRPSLANAPEPFTYPICGYTWFILYKDADVYGSYTKASQLVQFLKWVSNQGQLVAASESYPTMPKSILKDIRNGVREINYEDIILY